MFDYAIALTGGIATGKSSVAKLFKEDGFEVIDADIIAHEVLDKEASCVAKMFGSKMINGGRVDRKALGKVVFSDATQRKRLEALLHPLIYEQIKQEAAKLERKKRPYIVDIPLFFETNRYAISKVLVVYAPVSLQLKRIVLRDGSSATEAQKRIEAQIDIEEKVKKASYVIENRGTLEALKEEYLRVKREILGDFE